MDMLDGIGRWAIDGNSEPMIALIDLAGTGKSTIAAHDAEMGEGWLTAHSVLLLENIDDHSEWPHEYFGLTARSVLLLEGGGYFAGGLAGSRY
jgi:hypothetical protein